VAKPLAVVPDLEVELEELFARQPSEFTSVRNDLARRLKQAGRDEAAAEVKQLRKPTVPVWAVNQLARRHPEEVAALLQASEELRAAQGSALGGGEPTALRRATGAQRDALQALTQRAHDLLAAEGQAAASGVIERIASTLRTASLDPASRDLLERGRMDAELDPSGFDALAGVPVRARSGTRTRGRTAKPQQTAADKRRQERLGKLREAARTAAEAAEEAEREAEEAGRQAKSAATAATRARDKAERARAALEAAEGTAD
jgi:hypothetical protein